MVAALVNKDKIRGMSWGCLGVSWYMSEGYLGDIKGMSGRCLLDRLVRQPFSDEEYNFCRVG